MFRQIPSAFTHFSWIMILLILGNMAELSPLHHHEEEHACLQIDGTFFYFDKTSVDDETGSEQPALHGIRIGDRHEHPICGICQMASTWLLELPAHYVGNPNSELETRLISSDAIRPISAPFHQRGPPTNS